MQNIKFMLGKLPLNEEIKMLLQCIIDFILDKITSLLVMLK